VNQQCTAKTEVVPKPCQLITSVGVSSEFLSQASAGKKDKKGAKELGPGSNFFHVSEAHIPWL
jgi:hypothetical protein